MNWWQILLIVMAIMVLIPLLISKWLRKFFFYGLIGIIILTGIILLIPVGLALLGIGCVVAIAMIPIVVLGIIVYIIVKGL